MNKFDWTSAEAKLISQARALGRDAARENNPTSPKLIATLHKLITPTFTRQDAMREFDFGYKAWKNVMARNAAFRASQS